jgi:omega-hydroxy-beta-dihydromenaquinone-9 sulfotransferase
VTRIIERPIIIFGTGRSGTTIFFDILSCHENLAWPSGLCHSHPDRPSWNRLLMHGLDIPVAGHLMKRRWAPAEAHTMWERCCPGFRNPFRDLVADDLTESSAKRIRSTLGQLTTRKRHRLAVKITGWPRLLYLRKLFPDARFVHVSRDPRAVASSLLEVPWWTGWRGPSNWRCGPLPPDLEALWLEQDRSFVALAAIEYILFQRCLQRSLQEIPREQVLDVTYASLCADAIDTYRTVLAHCGLPWSKRFCARLMRFSLRNTDHKWREKLTPHQQEVLMHTLERGLARTEVAWNSERVT